MFNCLILDFLYDFLTANYIKVINIDPTNVRHILLVTYAGAYPTVKIVLPVTSDNEFKAGVDVAQPHSPPYKSAGASRRTSRPNRTASVAGTTIDITPASTT